MSGEAIVAIEAENRPFSWFEEGEAQGFSVEVCRRAFAAAGVQVRWRPVSGPFHLALVLGGGEAQAGLDVAVSERRRRWFHFSNGYFLDRLAAFLPRSGGLWPGLEHVRGRLAVRSNSYEEEFLRYHAPFTPLLPVDTALDLLTAVRTDKAMGFVLSEVAGQALLADAGEGHFREAGHSFAPCQLALAAMEGEETLLERFDEGLSRLSGSGEYDALLRRWFGEREAAGF